MSTQEPDPEDSHGDEMEEEGTSDALIIHETQHETSNSAGPTLLPTPIASAVSLVTRSSSLYLRLGTFIGGLALDGARVTTLTGLELSRAVIEGIIHRAGRDVATRSTGELGRAEAEGLLEKSINTLHSTITGISFAASTGFYFSATALASATDISQQLLGTLDAILGSTDSSRAIASIITLIRREFQNPATGVEGEKVSVSDLMLGMCGLALLQRWCRKITERENQESHMEEIIWDVVILNDGRRADVVGMAAEHNTPDPNKGIVRSGSRMSFMNTHGDEMIETIEREERRIDEIEDDVPEMDLRQKIMQSLPANASVSITTSTTTTKTITVEVDGALPPDFTPPPGVEVIEEDLHPGNNIDEKSTGSAVFMPKYKVVYRIVRNQLRGTNIQAGEEIPGDNTLDHHEMGESGVKELDNVPFDAPTDPSVRSSSPDPIPPPLPEKDFPISPSPTQNGPTGRSKIPRLSLQSFTSEDEKQTPSPDVKHSRTGSDDVAANQKKSRKPMSSSSSISGSDHPPPPKKLTKSSSLRRAKTDRPTIKPQDKEKKGSFRNVLRKGSSTALSNLWNKDEAKEPSPTGNAKTTRPPWGSSNSTSAAKGRQNPKLSVPQRNSSMVPARDAPRAPQRGNPNYFSSRDLGNLPSPVDVRSSSRASYFSVHETKRDSIISQTDTYSIHSAEQMRPGSPAAFRSQLKTHSGNLAASSRMDRSSTPMTPGSSPKGHRRVQSYEQSIFTLNTNNSESSLAPAALAGRSAFEDAEALGTLMRTGSIDGTFPRQHLVKNITRFVKFASASYGSSFLRMMGISTTNQKREIDTTHHHEHHSFSSHTQLPPDSILLSSFVDPQGGTDSSGNTNTGVPMVHFVSLDHQSKAVVLTCRGTLGFEDVLTDMTCDYDEVNWRGKAYKVHMGIHASARRLLNGGGGRVMATIKVALEEFPEYGLVLCGHSLGGGVTALLAIMLAEPAAYGTSFITSYGPRSAPLLLTSGDTGTSPSDLRLPPGRPVHVYAYGPPATISKSLRLATRGLITTIVNGQDLVPHLSLGVLHDLQAVALAFKNDDSGAKGEVRNRVWTGMTNSFTDKWYSRPGRGSQEEDDAWAYSALKTLRASMLSAKLVPPGEVFVVETMPVLKRNAFVKDAGESSGLGKPATRCVLKYIRDVEKRFGEISFGGSMLLDHSPGRYEASLRSLGAGILDE